MLFFFFFLQNSFPNISFRNTKFWPEIILLSDAFFFSLKSILHIAAFVTFKFPIWLCLSSTQKYLISLCSKSEPYMCTQTLEVWPSFNYCQSMSQALLYYCMVNFMGGGYPHTEHALSCSWSLALSWLLIKFLLSLIFLPKSHAVFTDANLPCQQQQPCVPLFGKHNHWSMS